MCARIIQTTEVHILRKIYDIETDNAIERGPSWNAPPGGLYNVVRAGEQGAQLAAMRWGLVPRHAVHASFAPHNARSETAHWKNTFREAFRRRRCVFPVNGWYEWATTAGGKEPHLIDRPDDGLLHLAGIWEPWPRGDGFCGFAVLTTVPGDRVGRIHHRQPNVLDSLEEVREWLSPATHPERLQEMSRHAGNSEYRIRKVSRAVNNARNDWPELAQATAQG